jgi:CheY-like chemotaxis protein
MPRPTVVLIEDDEAVAHELSRALFALGLAPRTYTGWRAASEALEGLDTGMWPDAMIVDLDLPHVPGTILIQTLIQRGLDPRETRLVLMTGYEMDGGVRHIAQRLGVRDVLAKPFRRRRLAEALGLPLPSAPAPTGEDSSVTTLDGLLH